jgi:DNA-directed RNA polymerase specialized sigma24 family protein
MTKQTEPAEVFEQVLLSHAEMCYSVALALTRNPEHAQELARRILTGAWQLRDSAAGRKDIKMKLLAALRKRYLKDRCEARAVDNEAAFAERA